MRASISAPIDGTALKELELCCKEKDVAAILKGLPSQLRSLRPTYEPSKQDFNAIAVHCTRLRHLQMIFGYYDYEKFFEAIGPGLEHLDFEFSDKVRVAQGLALIKKYCRNLHSLVVGSFTCCLPLDDVTELVVSYSTNLEAVTLPALSLKQYQEIASKCPAVDCTVFRDNDKDVEDAMLGLQDRLVSLSFTTWNEHATDANDIETELPIESLIVAASKCSRVA